MDRFLDPLYIAPLLVCAFFAVLFLQSGLDKVFDWKGNSDWLIPHFSKTPFRNMVPLLLAVLTVMEVAAGAVSAIAVGVVLFAMQSARPWVVASFGLVALALLMLFAGQRIAKDYVGAANLAIYFGIVALSLFMLGPNPMRF